MLILSAEDVRKALPMDLAIEAMKGAFAALSEGKAVVPERIHLSSQKHDGVTLVMPALVDDSDHASLAVKVVSLFGNNAQRGLARIQAAVVAFEPDTGCPIALLEGARLTAIRTGAASGAATDLMARADSRVAAVFGAGVQARTQIEAVCTVRPIETVWVYDPIQAAAEAFAAEMAGQSACPADVRVASDSKQAVADADVICTASVSKTPVFADEDLKSGVHINAIGSYQPDVREIPGATVARSRLVVDSKEAALAETGDLIQPIRQGLIDTAHLRAELGDLVLEREAGRTSDEQVTLFKAVGIAVQDAAAAQLAVDRAKTLGLGHEVPW